MLGPPLFNVRINDPEKMVSSEMIVSRQYYKRCQLQKNFMRLNDKWHMKLNRAKGERFTWLGGVGKGPKFI